MIGGPQGDAGLTGRKIIVDTYGGWGAHGGGAFSGKDFSKVDRSAAYTARWIGKFNSTTAKMGLLMSDLQPNLLFLLASLAVRLFSFPMPLVLRSPCRSMLIPMAPERRPMKSWSRSFVRTGISDLVSLVSLLYMLWSWNSRHFSVRELDLQKPQYLKTASYGHFGNPDYSWEKPKKLRL